jgi:hypothetical protein
MTRKPSIALSLVFPLLASLGVLVVCSLVRVVLLPEHKELVPSSNMALAKADITSFSVEQTSASLVLMALADVAPERKDGELYVWFSKTEATLTEPLTIKVHGRCLPCWRVG